MTILIITSIIAGCLIAGVVYLIGNDIHSDNESEYYQNKLKQLKTKQRNDRKY